MEDLTHEELAEAYLTHYRSKRDEDLWAFSAVTDVCWESGRTGSNDFWILISCLIKKATTDDELEYIGAGPLEDYVGSEEAAECVAERARVDAKWHRAAKGVFIGEEEPAYLAWQAIRKELGLTGSDALE